MDLPPLPREPQSQVLYAVLQLQLQQLCMIMIGWVTPTPTLDGRELYHVLSVRDDADDDEEEEEEDVPPHYDLFDSFKPEHNKHLPFEFKA